MTTYYWTTKGEEKGEFLATDDRQAVTQATEIPKLYSVYKIVDGKPYVILIND